MLELNRIIQETVTWICKVNVDFEKNYFRSDELKPMSCKDYLELPPNEFYKVIAKRRSYLQENGIELLTEKEISKLGKLIWSEPEDSVHDGGAEAYAQGIYDISECPPWDTWITKGQDFEEFKHLGNPIISWLPNEHFNKFYSGKSVSMLDNMDWITELSTDNHFVQTIIGVPPILEFEETPIKWLSSEQLEINNKRWT